jgi:TRIAD3 protein (E3 ubiquitin-protein ligase RNF216)
VATIDKERLIEEKMNEAVVRVCPRCTAQFMKEEGCNKMECPRCKVWICYWCRQEIPREVGYSHFWSASGACPPDKCPLWVTGERLHRLEAAKAEKQWKEDLGDAE